MYIMEHFGFEHWGNTIVQSSAGRLTEVWPNEWTSRSVAGCLARCRRHQHCIMLPPTMQRYRDCNLLQYEPISCTYLASTDKFMCSWVLPETRVLELCSQLSKVR